MVNPSRRSHTIQAKAVLQSRNYSYTILCLLVYQRNIFDSTAAKNIQTFNSSSPHLYYHTDNFSYTLMQGQDKAIWIEQY